MITTEGWFSGDFKSNMGVSYSDPALKAPWRTVAFDNNGVLTPISILNPLPVTGVTGGGGGGGTVTQGPGGTSPWLITGAVSISNFPVTQAVSGTMTALQGTVPWIVDGSGVIQPVSGSVSVLNFPASQLVTQGTNPWAVSGNMGRTWLLAFATDSVNVSGSSVSVTNFPVTQAVSGTMTALQGTVPWVVAVTGSLPAGTGTIGAVALVDGFKATYGAAYAELAVAALATDVFVIRGSATKTVRVTYVSVTATRTTAGPVQMWLTIRTSANSGGTTVAAPTCNFDQTDPPPTATVVAYTANATTLGTSGGFPRAPVVLISPMTTTDSQSDAATWTFGTTPGTKAIVLRGTGQSLAVFLNGTTVAGGSFNYSVEWTEE